MQIWIVSTSRQVVRRTHERPGQGHRGAL